MKARTTLIFIFLLSLFNLKSQTVIQAGDVYGDWLTSGSPYLIEGDIHLPSDERLRIWPGVQVVFQGQYGFEVEGKLDATGTITDSITFTYFDTTGFSQGNFNGWNGLTLIGYNYSFSDSSIMAYCNIEYSGYTGISCFGYPFLAISNSEVRFNQSSGWVLFDFTDLRAESIVIRDNKAGGLVCSNSSPQMSNFIIKNNLGSGIIISGNSSGSLHPLFSNGKIQNNKSPYNGGGISIDIDAFAYFDNVEIIDNRALNGGGIYCGMAYLDLNNVVIRNNNAEYGGGVFGSYYSFITMKYNLVVKNQADMAGGGAYISQGELELINCTMCANTSGEVGGGLVYDCDIASQSTIRNSIIWNNIPDEIEVLGYGPAVSYSDINGGFEGIENIDTDPLFIDPLNYDFRLSWISYPQENGSKSPCIDAGDPVAYQDPDGTFSDMGAYYFDQGVFTSVTDSKFPDEICIFPNPAQNLITISNSNAIDRIVIYNLVGNIMIDQQVNLNNTSFDMSGLNSGVYLAKLFHNLEIVSTQKIIKK